MTEEAAKIQEQIVILEQEIEELSKSICYYCSGEGEIIDKTRISVITIDVPYCKCPECRGRGITI